MAKTNTFKWCLLIVVFLALFVYQRQSLRKSQLKYTNATELNLNQGDASSANEVDVYTTVPVQDPLRLGVGHEPLDSAAHEFVRRERLDAAPRLPFADSVMEDSVTEKRVDDLFEFEKAEPGQDSQILPTNLPRPGESDVDVVNAANHKFDLSRPIALPEGVQMKVVQHIEYGKSLARRGAVFGAKSEFHNALRLVAQSIDYQTQSKQFTQCLVQALVAIEEADDFYFAQSENNGQVDVPAIAMRHESEILTHSQLQTVNAVEAMQIYYNFVQDNLVRSSGKTVVAGEALYCLGKLFSLNSKNVVEGSPLDNAKAIVHHRSAISCDARNYKSANELAVLLVKSGRFEQAKKLLIHSLKIKQVPAAWENLAIIHQELGEQRLATLAANEYQRMLSAPPSTQQIKWVSPEKFAAGSVDPVELRTANATSDSQPENSTKPKSKSFKNFLNRLF